MNKLAILIMTFNEEKHIGACMETAQFADEIVVLDSGSTDRTREIAESLGAKFFVRPMGEGGFAAQRNHMLTLTDADWVFYLDADERISPEAAKEMLEIVREDRQAGYAIMRYNVVMGQLMKRGAHGPDWTGRLYPRTAIVWEGKVHEGVKTDLPLKRLKGTMMHYTYDDWETYLRKLNQYTSFAAEGLYEKGKKGGSLTLLGHAVFGFLKGYVLKLGFTEGWLGFVMSVMAGFSIMVKYLKLQNMQRLAKEKKPVKG